ncbi:MerR family transcriptional regulator [Microvirga terricola]|uniref:Helix-turn-helix domain-containing protein n=1 Tax=Microvirga terricola TaxID=2719797 RepID=A0ABX0VHH2_9HYPH|nr:helix-turn-helix domain-containing protein [Microvirga terricola]NIX78360.1 helix-turn-helix domain-containing protein [Microvirga terricola]
MLERTFSIGHVAAVTGCKVETIRFYEGIGLLPEPERTEGNQRRYLAKHVERLRFIMHARELGLAVEAIRQLIALGENPSAPCEQADEIARQQLESVRRKIARLTELAAELERIVASCDGKSIADCRVFEVLADHSTCDHGGAKVRP